MVFEPETQVTAVLGTAAVVTRAPLRCPAGLRRSVLGGSGVLMSAASVVTGHPVRLVSHIGCDADGDRIRTWARRNGVNLSPARVGSRTVHLVEEFADGEGVIAAGTSDLGPARSQVKLAVERSGLLLVGDTSTKALAFIVQLLRYRRTARLPTPTAVANLSAATVRSWPQARALWALADVVTVGEQELQQLDLTHSDARRLLPGGATLAITAGPQPVSVYSEGGPHILDVPALFNPVDTMGAGDAFAVILARSLSRGSPLRQSAALAIQAAQLMCRADSVEELSAGSWALSEAGPDPPVGQKTRRDSARMSRPACFR